MTPEVAENWETAAGFNTRVPYLRTGSIGLGMRCIMIFYSFATLAAFSEKPTLLYLMDFIVVVIDDFRAGGARASASPWRHAPAQVFPTTPENEKSGNWI